MAVLTVKWYFDGEGYRPAAGGLPEGETRH
jgi:hypothetical protein